MSQAENSVSKSKDLRNTLKETNSFLIMNEFESVLGKREMLILYLWISLFIETTSIFLQSLI